MSKDPIKDAFFSMLHDQISKMSGLSVTQVETIRSFALGDKQFSKEQVAEWCEKKLTQKREATGKSCVNRRSKSKKYYQELLSVIERCTPQDWAYITQEAKVG
jgi:hypothetical protein